MRETDKAVGVRMAILSRMCGIVVCSFSCVQVRFLDHPGSKRYHVPNLAQGHPVGGIIHRPPPSKPRRRDPVRPFSGTKGKAPLPTQTEKERRPSDGLD